MPFLNQLKKSFLHFVYPPHCLHCSDRLLNEQSILCSSCSSLLDLMDIEERCPLCFGEDYSKATSQCGTCRHGEHVFYRMASTFEYRGPAASLVKKLKYEDQPYLAEGLGAFLAIQFDRLKWPIPDAIVPVPLSFTHWLERGYNQSVLLANELASFLQVPVWDILERESGDYSQVYLNLSQRKKLEDNKFMLKKGHCLKDKTLLVLDDIMTTGSTLNCCAKALAESYPSRLYALTVCCA